MIEYEKINERNNLASYNNNYNNEGLKEILTLYTHKKKYIYRKGKFCIKKETKIKTKEYLFS